MTGKLLTTAYLLAALLAGGCAHETITPMPGVLPSTGLLLRCERIPLARGLELRRIELLRSDISNDFYPLNVSRGVPVDRLVSQLHVRDGVRWKFLDFVRMPLAKAHAAANLSGDGQRIIYERPDIAEGEGEFPRAYPRDRRTYRVAIYDRRTGRRALLDRFAELYSLGAASHWRPDGQAAAFTTTCYVDDQPCPQVAVVDACGQAILDAEMMPELRNLEFISYSPDGARIAALRPSKPRTGGRDGGALVEVNVEEQTLKDVAEISPPLACEYLNRFGQMVVWDADGHCRLRD